jgi:diguanylate cyclase (GGDEF)-like protein
MASQTHQAHDASPPASPSAPELALVRLHLAIALGGTAILVLVFGGLVAVFLPPGLQAAMTDAVRHAPSWLLIAAGVPTGAALALVAQMIRQVLEPAEELARSRHEYSNLYQTERTNALVDSLTGLGNHRAFQEALDRLLEQSRQAAQPLALALIDLDDFKLVNDSAGHSVGDELLAEFGRLLTTVGRRGDQAFRVGGDEFAIVLPRTDAGSAEAVVRRLLAVTTEARPDGGFAKPFSFSAGVAATPEHGHDRDLLYAHADAALYEVKRHGRTGVIVFDSTQRLRVIDGADLARRSAAVAELVLASALRPVYQPVVDLATGQVVGFEGLVRPLRDSGFDGPGDLFDVAERSGRTFDLDQACIEVVAKGACNLAPDQFLAINISPRSLEAPEFSAAGLARLLARHGIASERVLLEVTEREAIEQLDRLRATLAACQKLGMRVAADDVGAGNAGLRLLASIHFDIVKIDLSLVQAGSRRSNAVAVVRSLTHLAAQWGSVVVAEGIEDVQQLQMIQDIGIGKGQGYLLGRPKTDPTLRHVDLAGLLIADRSPSFVSRLSAAAG